MNGSPLRYVPRPATSFPYRDLLLLERLQLRPDSRVCEVGVGSGASAVRLAALCHHVTGIDVAEGAVNALRGSAAGIRNLAFHSLDVTGEIPTELTRAFSLVVSCDTLEHVADAGGYCRGIATLLEPGGDFLVTFPNEPPDRMHGVTRFGRPEDLLEYFRSAGLVHLSAGAAVLTPWASRVADSLARLPLRLVRRVTGGGSDNSTRPQVFDETAFFRHRRAWDQVAPLVNLYWYLVLKLMTRRGPAFEIDWGFRRTIFDNCQVVVEGRAPAAPRT